MHILPMVPLLSCRCGPGRDATAYLVSAADDSRQLAAHWFEIAIHASLNPRVAVAKFDLMNDVDERGMANSLWVAVHSIRAIPRVTLSLGWQ